MIKDGGYKLYENPDALSKVRPSNPLETDGTLVPKIVKYGFDEIQIIPNIVGKLTIADTYFPGWRAFAGNGSELKIVQSDGIFREIDIKDKDGLVKMVYRPWGFRVGLWTTLVSLFGIFIMMGTRLKNEKA